MNVLSASQRDTQSNPARPSSCNGCTTTQPRLARSTGRAVFYALKARGSSPQPTPDWPIWKVVKKKKKGRKEKRGGAADVGHQALGVQQDLCTNRSLTR